MFFDSALHTRKERRQHKHRNTIPRCHMPHLLLNRDAKNSSKRKQNPSWTLQKRTILQCSRGWMIPSQQNCACFPNKDPVVCNVPVCALLCAARGQVHCTQANERSSRQASKKEKTQWKNSHVPVLLHRVVYYGPCCCRHTTSKCAVLFFLLLVCVCVCVCLFSVLRRRVITWQERKTRQCPAVGRRSTSLLLRQRRRK